MLLFNIGEAPKIISAIFGPFLTIFTLFHLQFLLQSKNLPQIISGTPQFLIGLVNNARNQCQKLCKIFWLLNFLQRRCALYLLVTKVPGSSHSTILSLSASIWLFCIRSIKFRAGNELSRSLKFTIAEKDRTVSPHLLIYLHVLIVS